MGGLLGGPKVMLAPPLKLLGGPGPPGPPSSYAYELRFELVVLIHNYLKPIQFYKLMISQNLTMYHEMKYSKMILFGHDETAWNKMSMLYTTVELQWLEHLWDH